MSGPADSPNPGNGPAARLLATLGFLTRLAPARVLPEADMRRAMFHLPVCGLLLGLAVAAPLAGLHALGLAQGKALLLAFLATLLFAWLTRGLHLDGLADICDGAASHVDPERFWTILKDSRSGAFGVAAMALFLMGQVVLLAEALRGADTLRLILVLAWVPLFGRGCGVLFGYAHRALTRPGLGGLFLSGATVPAVLWAALLALALGLVLDPLASALAALCAGLLLLPLSRLGRSVGGVNGDFLGAAILLGETAAALALALARNP